MSWEQQIYNELKSKIPPSLGVPELKLSLLSVLPQDWIAPNQKISIQIDVHNTGNWPCYSAIVACLTGYIDDKFSTFEEITHIVISIQPGQHLIKVIQIEPALLPASSSFIFSPHRVLLTTCYDPITNPIKLDVVSKDAILNNPRTECGYYSNGLVNRLTGELSFHFETITGGE